MHRCLSSTMITQKSGQRQLIQRLWTQLLTNNNAVRQHRGHNHIRAHSTVTVPSIQHQHVVSNLLHDMHPLSLPHTFSLMPISLESAGIRAADASDATSSGSAASSAGANSAGDSSASSSASNRQPFDARDQPRPPLIPLIPLTARPGLPGSVFRWVLDPDNRYVRKAIEQQESINSPYVGIFMSRRKDDTNITLVPPETSNGAVPLSAYDDVNKYHGIGVLAEYRTTSDHITLICHRRIQITQLVSSEGFLTVKVKHFDEMSIEEAEELERIAANTNQTQDIHAEQQQHPHAVNNIDKKSQPQSTKSETTPSGATAKSSSSSSDDTAPAAPESRSAPLRQMYAYLQYGVSQLLPHDDIAKRAKALATPHVNISIAGHLADYAASLCAVDPQSIQDVLSLTDLRDRMYHVCLMVRSEIRLRLWQRSIQDNIKATINEQHRIDYLKQQKKSLEKMLGGRDSHRQQWIDKFNKRLKNKILPPHIKQAIDEEMDKIISAESEGSEYNVSRNYLDWLTILPWSIYTPEKYDLISAEEILNEDHYGLDEIKQRILEWIATAKLSGGSHTQSAKILCLVGPPGVGKTSIGKSVARALDRQFYRFSVGGMEDVAEIKGHRRTYLGALPGKLIQMLKRTQAMNTVVLIDEIDKLGRGYRGDPAAALLEVLDPEQNKAFLDHYLDQPVDLSQIVFLCTANDQSRIPGPLADRMDFIQVSGYVESEKLQIVQKYLEPAVRLKTGIHAEDLVLTSEAIEDLIRWYCREPGVRNLQKHVEKIYRKAAFRLAKARQETAETTAAAAVSSTTTTSATTPVSVTASENRPQPVDTTPVTDKPAAVEVTPVQAPVVVTKENLAEYAGKPVYMNDSLYVDPPVGVAVGLAWSSNGGATIYVESTLAEHVVTARETTSAVKKKKHIAVEEGKGGLIITGQLGDVMKESASIAYTVAKRALSLVDPKSSFFHSSRIHLHLPSGSTPKDGPSAGITMVCSLLSLALDLPPQRLAMTGELTLTGRVLPVGGIKEKMLAARRDKQTTVILPAENRKDWDELQDVVKAGLDVTFVTTFEEVFMSVFPSKASALRKRLTDTTDVNSAAASVPIAIDSTKTQPETPENNKTKKPRLELPTANPTPTTIPPEPPASSSRTTSRTALN